MWSDVIEGSQLTSLKLPSNIHPTGAWLREIAAKHTKLEHLSLSSPCESITVECENPFEGFGRLKSLSLKVNYRTNQLVDHKPIGVVLDGLCLESLELSGLRFEHRRRWSSTEDEEIWSETELLIPGPVSTPNLMKSLVHLHVDYDVDVQYAEYILYHCRYLKTLHLGYIGETCKYPALIQSRHHMPPFLRLLKLETPEYRREDWVSRQ